MIPLWFWIVSGLLLIWNMIGCVACYTQLAANADKIARLPEVQRDSWLAMPAIAKVGYVIAVGAGLLGSIALLLKSFAAGPLFIASLIGVIIQFGWFFVVFKGASKLGASSAAFPAFIALITIGEICLVAHAHSQGWLG